MAHPDQLDFVRTISQHLSDDWTDKRVLEIGSYQVNGSIRPFFQGSAYLGVDLMEGAGVDVVSEGSELDRPDEIFDLSVSCECFEHNPKWLATFLNMYRMTRKGGAVVFTCAAKGRLEHGTTRTGPESSPGTQIVGWDYYMNLTEREFTKKLDMDKLFDSHFFITNRYACDLYFIGIKRGNEQVFRFEGQSLREECVRVREQRRCAEEAQSRFPAIIRFASRLTYLPVLLARALPDRHYQNLALRYHEIRERVKVPMKHSVEALLARISRGR